MHVKISALGMGTRFTMSAPGMPQCRTIPAAGRKEREMRNTGKVVLWSVVCGLVGLLALGKAYAAWNQKDKPTAPAKIAEAKVDDASKKKVDNELQKLVERYKLDDSQQAQVRKLIEERQRQVKEAQRSFAFQLNSLLTKDQKEAVAAQAKNKSMNPAAVKAK